MPPLLDNACTLAKWLCRNGADGEDIVQEAAIRALKALETTAVERPKPWFLMIVRNTAMTWMAKNRPKTFSYAGDLADLDAIGSRARAILMALRQRGASAGVATSFVRFRARRYRGRAL